jgi:hypothetical protein
MHFAVTLFLVKQIETYKNMQLPVCILYFSTSLDGPTVTTPPSIISSVLLKQEKKTLIHHSPAPSAINPIGSQNFMLETIWEYQLNISINMNKIKLDKITNGGQEE